MSYTIHHIRGIVLRTTAIGEQSAWVSVLSDDDMVISMRAESGLYSKKFSPALTTGSVGVFDVLRAKNGWKLVGVSGTTNSILTVSSMESIRMMLSVVHYAHRFCSAGETETIGLYTLVYRALAKCYEQYSPEIYDSFRFQLLQLLGYIDVTSVPLTKNQILRLILRAEENAHL